MLFSQTRSSPLEGYVHVMRTSYTNMNFGFKPLLHLHLNYVNIKPKPCEIQNREISSWFRMEQACLFPVLHFECPSIGLVYLKYSLSVLLWGALQVVSSLPPIFLGTTFTSQVHEYLFAT